MILAAILAAAALGLMPVQASAMSQEEISMLKGPDRQKVLEEGAKKEGAVGMYASLSADTGIIPLLEGFKKKYPFITKSTYYRGSSRQILTKVLAEKRGHALMADVVEGSGMALSVIKANVAEAFYSPSLADHPKAFYDSKGLYAADRVAYFTVLYNTKQIKPSEAPASYDDLLDPKWKGKIAWRVGAESGAPLFITNILLAKGDKEGEAYLKKLGQQKIVNFSSSARTLVDRIGQGEYPMGINMAVDLSIDVIAKGAPVVMKALPPAPVTSNTIQLVKGAPHPYAAMLLLDFILGKDGQTILAKQGFFVPHRNITLIDAMKQALPRTHNVEEKVISPETLFKYHDKSEDLYKKYFR